MRRNPARLIVGLDAAPPPPLQFGPPGTPEFKGLEVDLLAAVGAALGRQLDYEVALWSTLLDRLAEGRLDLVCTAATVTEPRARRFAFGVGYLPISLVLAAPDEGGIMGTADLAGARVAVRLATVADEWAGAHLPGAHLARFELNTEAYDALRRRAVDALIDDAPIARWFVAATPGLHIVTALPDTAAEYAMVFARANDSLRGSVDAVLRNLAGSGELERLRQEWLGEP